MPTGKTVLHVGDRLMLFSDNQEELEHALDALGIGTKCAISGFPRIAPDTREDREAHP